MTYLTNEKTCTAHVEGCPVLKGRKLQLLVVSMESVIEWLSPCGACLLPGDAS